MAGRNPELRLKGDESFVQRLLGPSHESSHFLVLVDANEFVWTDGGGRETFRRIDESSLEQ